MSDLTRRGFVRSSAAAAAGIAAVGAFGVGDAEARQSGPSSGPVVAYVRDPGSGEIAIMSGAGEVRIRDRKLAAQISRAAG